MNSATAIQHIVLDFDGTCTQIPKVWETYLELYFKALPRGSKSQPPSGGRLATRFEYIRPKRHGLWPDAPPHRRQQTPTSWPTRP